MAIRVATSSDSKTIVDIYNDYIESTMITFEEESISEQEMASRVLKVQASGLPWLVSEVDGLVLGYAYASLWHARSAYRFTVEPTIYLAPEAAGKGLGKALYQHLLDMLRQLDIKQAIGVIALPNPASVGLHESLGFEKVGEFNEVGYKFDRYISVGYWQLSFS